MPESHPGFSQWLVDVRRHLHAHPETAHEEIKTTEKIVEILSDARIPVQTFPGMTGAVGLISGTGEGPTIALRADIDALPIAELNEVPYKSRHPGVMHACGHDANTAIMLGVARKIQDTGFGSSLRGHVKFLFQPAEERGSGAKAMIERGVLDNPGVDCIIAGHMSTDLAVGRVGVFQGLGYASSDVFELAIRGKGAHGARPEEGIDPVVAGASFVTSVQSIPARNVKPTEAAAVTVGKFTAGDAPNVIPEFAYLEGTVRALSREVRARVIERLRQIAEGLEPTFLVKTRFQLREGCPVCVNDETVARLLYETSINVLGKANVAYLPPVMASEDFAYFALQRPSAIMRLGCSNKEEGEAHPLHSPYFDIDERVLEIGVNVFYEAVRRYLGAGSR
jgi:amidohydrolase